MAINDFSGWEKVKPLGEGGQSEVFLVRDPARVEERRNCVEQMRIAMDRSKMDDFANLSWTYSRPDQDSELGALKVFKIPQGVSPGEREIQWREDRRFQNEVKVLKENLPGLPKLLSFNEDQFWIITEYFREGSLKKQLAKFKGNALLSLVAFRSLVATVETLHERGIVHRDIKPANVYVARIDELILGDLGIVCLQDAEDRPTELGERVGPRDYMAPWLDTGDRVDEVTPSSDVYMLGKLLWCMVSGRIKLPYNYYRRPNLDLTKQFPDSIGMEQVNLILDACVVLEEHVCLQSAGELLLLVELTMNRLQVGNRRILPGDHLNYTCLMCGKGKYKPKVDNRQESLHFNIRLHDPQNMPLSEARVRLFVCDFCTHHAFFSPGYPEEAEKRAEERGWPS